MIQRERQTTKIFVEMQLIRNQNAVLLFKEKDHVHVSYQHQQEIVIGYLKIDKC